MPFLICNSCGQSMHVSIEEWEEAGGSEFSTDLEDDFVCSECADESDG